MNDIVNMDTKVRQERIRAGDDRPGAPGPAKKKKILHISKYYYPFSGGTEQIARDCVCALKDSYDQKVIAFSEGKQDEAISVDGIEVVKCGCIGVVASQPLSATYGRNLKRMMKEYMPDVIIFHYPNPFVAFYLLRYLKKFEQEKHIALVLYWHLDIVKQKFLRKFFRPQNYELLRRADRIIATSPNYIEGSYWLSKARDKCVVVPNCINVERMRITPQIEARAAEIRNDNKGKTICVAVGRHTEYKGFTYLIRASKLLSDDFRIYLTGVGELTEQLREEAKDDPKIIFTGRVEDNELKALIQASDIFCFPSITKNEAFGLALAEGMYYGKPAITFTIPGSGVNYVNINGETGIEVANRDVEAYAQAMMKLARDPQLREQYGRAGRQRVFDNFLSTEFVNNIQKVIRMV